MPDVHGGTSAASAGGRLHRRTFLAQGIQDGHMHPLGAAAAGFRRDGPGSMRRSAWVR
ncbi:hypothetical protein ACFPH6_13415 [Streptomyces xiangluensis]|uniref:Uncharacterized protein n=1 Tax=Streptomyces xiangluensis TaxID=2665720 RepID=A0ABV8YLB9_9ACTN